MFKFRNALKVYLYGFLWELAFRLNILQDKKQTESLFVGIRKEFLEILMCLYACVLLLFRLTAHQAYSATYNTHSVPILTYRIDFLLLHYSYPLLFVESKKWTALF